MLKRFKRELLALVGVLICTEIALAERAPLAGRVDSRIKTLVYSEYDVYDVTFHYGYQGLIQLDPEERIVNFSIGDSIAWQIVPNNSGNLLFIKPVENNANTNMTIVTDKRIYSFALRAEIPVSRRDDNLAFRVKFEYPEIFSEEKFLDKNRNLGGLGSYNNDDGVGLQSLHLEYGFSGDEELAPSAVFDNGEFTFFEFDSEADLPAIYSVDGDLSESVVNFHVEGNFLVVHELSDQFMLRRGRRALCVRKSV